jgi:putative glutamine amidotransferase
MMNQQWTSWSVDGQPARSNERKTDMTQISIHRQPQYTPDASGWHRPIIALPWSAGRRSGLFAPVWRAYSEVIEQAGGTPLWLHPLAGPDALAPLWMWLDGLLLPGGVDVHPFAYGEDPHPLLGAVDPEADRLELWLAQEALQRDLPVLGINRGMQVMNVACGGSLVQDLTAQRETAIPHVTVGQPRQAHAHPVSIVADTRLAALIGSAPAFVNSFHHQGVKDLGKDLAVAALAPDDVIEAIERPAQRFALGVQCAIEALVLDGDRRMQRVFAGFIDAAREYGMQRQARLLHGRAALERWERMWVRDLAAYSQGRERLYREEMPGEQGDLEPLGVLEALELRRDLSVLKGRVQAVTEALGLPDPTPPAGRL